jgi:hypothetical protein
MEDSMFTAGKEFQLLCYKAEYLPCLTKPTFNAVNTMLASGHDSELFAYSCYRILLTATSTLYFHFLLTFSTPFPSTELLHAHSLSPHVTTDLLRPEGADKHSVNLPPPNHVTGIVTSADASL